MDRSDQHMHELVRGASVAFIVKVVGVGLSFGFNVLLARLLGAEGTGIFFLALTVTTIAAVFGRLGLDNAVLRFTAASSAIGDWAAVKGVYQKGMILALTGSIISAAVILGVAPWLAEAVFSKLELTNPIRWMALAVVPMALLTLHAELLKGVKHIRDSQLVQGVGVPTLSLIGLYLLGRVWGVQGAVWAYIIATVLTALVGNWLWKSAAPQIRDINGLFKMRELLGSCMPLLCVTILSLVIDRTAIFMLGIWGTKAEVGIFGVASRTAMLTSFILISVNSIAAPKFAALYKQGDMAALGSTARGSTKLMTLMASPVLLLFIFAPGWVMGMFGPQFVKGTSVLIILAIGQYVNVATGSVGYLLMMSGYEMLMRNNIIGSAVLSILLNILLVPKYGIVGAALAGAISIAWMNIVSAVIVYLKLSINTLPIPNFRLFNAK